MILERFPEIQQLSASEKMALAHELFEEAEWDSVAIPYKENILADLNRRMEQFESHVEDCATWESVKARLHAPKQ